MKNFKLNHHLLFTVLILCLLPCALPAQKLHDQSKVIRNKFTVQPKDILEINTNYAKVEIEEWDKNEISFITTITLKNSSEKDFENLINAIQLSNKQSGKTVSYSLSIEWSGKAKTNNLSGSTEITLKIVAPKDIFYVLTARYGDVVMENAHNDFSANIRYGNLKANDMFGSKNNITINYGNLDMEDLHGTRNQVTLNYGKFNIYKAEHLTLGINYVQGEISDMGALKLNSKYGTIICGSVKSLALTSGYDKITIQNQVDIIDGEMKYSTLLVNSLKTSCNLPTFSFSNVTINEIQKSFTTINVTASYSNIKLNIPQELTFALDYSGRYTDFKDKSIKLNDTSFLAENNMLQISGIFGKGSDSGKSVKIDARYGSVSLFGK